MADYALSSEYITPHLEARLASGAFADRYQHISPAMLRAEPETMRHMLNTMNAQFGPSNEARLAHGITERQIENLRNNLLED